MKSIVYGLGILLLIAGTAGAVAEAFFTLVEGGHRSLALGTVWYRLHADSLLGLRALIELRLGPALWTPVVHVLALPAWVVFAVPGLVLLLLARERLRRP
jgi:hypothetical protein